MAFAHPVRRFDAHRVSASRDTRVHLCLDRSRRSPYTRAPSWCWLLLQRTNRRPRQPPPTAKASRPPSSPELSCPYDTFQRMGCVDPADANLPMRTACGVSTPFAMTRPGEPRAEARCHTTMRLPPATRANGASMGFHLQGHAERAEPSFEVSPLMPFHTAAVRLPRETSARGPGFRDHLARRAAHGRPLACPGRCALPGVLDPSERAPTRTGSRFRRGASPRILRCRSTSQSARITGSRVTGEGVGLSRDRQLSWALFTFRWPMPRPKLSRPPRGPLATQGGSTT